jgi:hypothetical protein
MNVTCNIHPALRLVPSFILHLLFEECAFILGNYFSPRFSSRPFLLKAAHEVMYSFLVSWFGIKMGYLGFFYVESKSFELSSEAGKRCKLTEWGRGKLKSLEMGFSRMIWLLKSLEEVSLDSVEMGSCRNHRMEESVVFIQKRQNGNRRFMEISEFGRGGKCSQVVIPEGWDRCGWNQCIHQLRLLAKHIEEQGFSTHKKKSTVQDQFVVEGRSFAEVVEGKKKGCDHEALPVMDAENGSDGGVASSF